MHYPSNWVSTAFAFSVILPALIREVKMRRHIVLQSMALSLNSEIVNPQLAVRSFGVEC